MVGSRSAFIIQCSFNYMFEWGKKENMKLLAPTLHNDYTGLCSSI